MQPPQESPLLATRVRPESAKADFVLVLPRIHSPGRAPAAPWRSPAMPYRLIPLGRDVGRICTRRRALGVAARPPMAVSR